MLNLSTDDFIGGLARTRDNAKLLTGATNALNKISASKTKRSASSKERPSSSQAAPRRSAYGNTDISTDP